MDTNKMREQFESKFPKPIGMVWCDVARQYVKALGCICPAAFIAAHNRLWKCWQASRETLVVDLSECGVELFDGGPYYDQCRVGEAIEAQGLRVNP